MPEIKPQALPYVRGREKLLNWRQVCERLSISRSTFYRLAGMGEFGSIFRVGQGLRVSEKGLEEYLVSRRTDPLH